MVDCPNFTASVSSLVFSRSGIDAITTTKSYTLPSSKLHIQSSGFCVLRSLRFISSTPSPLPLCLLDHIPIRQPDLPVSLVSNLALPPHPLPGSHRSAQHAHWNPLYSLLHSLVALLSPQNLIQGLQDASFSSSSLS